MARTYRRRHGRKRNLNQIMCGPCWILGSLIKRSPPDPQSQEAYRLRARYHSDAYVIWGGSPPRYFRKRFDRTLRASNRRVLQHWLRQRDFDPVFQNSHLHSARRDWW